MIVADADGNAFELRPIDCPTCERPASKILGYRGGRYHRYGAGVASLIKRCDRCGLIFPDPFPYPVEPQRLYGDPEKYFERHNSLEKVNNYRGIVRELRECAGSEGSALLDVGSGIGELLHAARLEGLEDATGLELSEAMVESAEARFGVDVLCETVEQHSRRVARKYDFIVLSAVLEHVHAPDSAIASVAKLSRPGTVLYVDVPNEPNLITMVGNAWNRLAGRQAVYNLSPTFTPFHVFGFNLRSLGVLLAKHGFAIEKSSVWAHPEIPASANATDRARAWAGTQIARVANHTGTATNLVAWARFEPGERA